MAARFKLDENIPRHAEILLRTAGHDVESALAERLGGSPDSLLLDACRREARVLVTFDLDFADIRVYPGPSHAGIWVLRPPRQSSESALKLLRGALTLLESETIQGRLCIVEINRIRIRE